MRPGGDPGWDTGIRATAALAGAGAAAAAAAWVFKALWDGFDVLEPSHWTIAYTGVVNWWEGNGGDTLPFTFILTALGCTVALVIVVWGAWRIGPALFVPIRWIGRAAALGAAGAVFACIRLGSGIGSRLDTPETRSHPPPDRGTFPEPLAERPETPLQPAAAAAEHPLPDQDANQDVDTDDPPAPPTGPAPGSGLDFTVSVLEPDTVRGSSNDPGDGATLDVASVRASLTLWLKDNGWTALADQAVNADSAEVAFEGDGFDGDPEAFIPLIAVSTNDITLIFIEDLDGEDWTGAAFDGIPNSPALWQSKLGTSRPCPVANAIRARTRFQYVHGSFLRAYNADLFPGTAGLPICLVFTNGRIDNTEAMSSCWTDAVIEGFYAEPVIADATGVPTIAPETIATMFGEPPDKAADPMIVNAIGEATRIARTHRKAS